MENRTDLHTALKWITRILDQQNIIYQLVGGLAARCYGATRPLHDIDFYIPGTAFSKLKSEVDEFIEFGPNRHKDENWDIIFMKLKYQGWQIEFGDADNTKYFDETSSRWINAEIDFANPAMIRVESLTLPVMPKKDLTAYKRRLNRKVDQLDLEEMAIRSSRKNTIS